MKEVELLLLDFDGITIKNFDLRIEDEIMSIFHDENYLDVNYVTLNEWGRYGIDSISYRYVNHVMEYKRNSSVGIVYGMGGYIEKEDLYTLNNTDTFTLIIRKDIMVDKNQDIIKFIKEHSISNGIMNSACDYVNYLMIKNREEQIDLIIT